MFTVIGQVLLVVAFIAVLLSAFALALWLLLKAFEWVFFLAFRWVEAPGQLPPVNRRQEVHQLVHGVSSTMEQTSMSCVLARALALPGASHLCHDTRLR